MNILKFNTGFIYDLLVPMAPLLVRVGKSPTPPSIAAIRSPRRTHPRTPLPSMKRIIRNRISSLATQPLGTSTDLARLHITST